jgi:hypothetical protein
MQPLEVSWVTGGPPRVKHLELAPPFALYREVFVHVDRHDHAFDGSRLRRWRDVQEDLAGMPKTVIPPSNEIRVIIGCLPMSLPARRGSRKLSTTMNASTLPPSNTAAAARHEHGAARLRRMRGAFRRRRPNH